MINESDYMKDHRGNLVPKKMVKEIDIIRNDLVLEIVKKATELNRSIAQFKQFAMGEIEAFVSQSAEQYGINYGGEKGNIQLHTFDGKFRLVKSIGEYIVFDERLQIAKKLIDDCVLEWSQGTRMEMAALINHSFEVNKQGKINTDRILSLRRLDIKNDKWIKAMEAIGDSITTTGSKSYIRLYERNDDEKYEQIPLDLASIDDSK